MGWDALNIRGDAENCEIGHFSQNKPYLEGSKGLGGES